ncbi:DUF1648 domain-containing protein [Desulfosporosinus acididurans]|uniref:DUF1648 domain-containing protein n=1 Tax=Desulfosporosinus acididurans TaxID=476652 RepID=UPI0013792BC0
MHDSFRIIRPLATWQVKETASTATSLIYPVIIWPSLPSKIPAHYNTQGQVDRWGSKGEIFLLVAVVVLMYIFLTY